MAKQTVTRPRKYRGYSPAGYAWLMEERKKTQPTYYKLKGLRRPTVETRLREAKISEEELRSLGYGKRLKRRK